jgi:catechol 2,3-dioxygenase-like lactoylglutathione lyase family enzyme
MRTHITGLDHVVIAVGDLAAAAAQLARLGFTVTERSEMPEWGLAGHRVMFGRDHLEVVASVGDGAMAERVRAFTAQQQGLMAVALGSSDIVAETARLRAAGLEVEAPHRLTRGPDIGSTVALLAAEVTPGVSAFLCQHEDAAHLRPAGAMVHANGTVRIASVTAVVDEPVALMPAWDRVLGPASTTPTDELVAVHSGRGLIFLASPDDFSQLHPEAEGDEPPAPPALSALVLVVGDTAKAARLLDDADIEFSRDTAGTIRVPPTEALGIYLEFQVE